MFFDIAPLFTCNLLRLKTYGFLRFSRIFYSIHGLRLDVNKKEKDRVKSSVLFCRLCAELFSVVALCNNLYSLVVTASLAYTVSKIYLAALRAGYEIGGCFKLPNAGTSFHFSRMRNLFLWYCHCNNLLLVEHAITAFSYMLFLFFISSSNF